MGFLLFIIAYILFLPLTVINFFYVEKKKGYFRSTARNIDIFANREFRAFWNKVLIEPDGYQFGKEGEPISSALGRNQLLKKLKPKGLWLVKQLDKIEEDHCIKSISYEI
ncbi:hypothetical protein ACM55H_05210 [Flavobacterium sp. ZT3R17]|uniref:hypothetical protein n=1 Tax=Flavobacterium cryoconiti TaxID=3398736 RepID=UPI003A83BAD0